MRQKHNAVYAYLAILMAVLFGVCLPSKSLPARQPIEVPRYILAVPSVPSLLFPCAPIRARLAVTERTPGLEEAQTVSLSADPLIRAPPLGAL